MNGGSIRPAGLFDHIKRCNARDLSRFRPFEVVGRRIGSVRDDFCAQLAEFDDTLEVSKDAVRLLPRHATAEARTSAMRAVVGRLIERRSLVKFRREEYAVVGAWGETPLFLLDRSAVPLFGLRAFGVHVNGYTKRGDRTLLWIGRRALDKAVDPGKLDNMVAGGQPAGLSLLENLVKEAAEEAGMPRALALRASPVGAITYCMESERGLKPDTMFVYDLEVPADFTPRNADGEISEFMLMELDEVAERMRASYDFKFNVNLVLIDYLIRTGYLKPESEPDYLALATGLRTAL